MFRSVFRILSFRPSATAALLATLFVAAGPLLPFAEAATTGTLILSFRDSRSGKAVVPESVVINGSTLDVEVDRSGLMSIQLGGGQHQVQVNAEGYDPFEATVAVDGDDTPVNTFELDRETSPALEEELPPLDTRIAVLEGYVVDAALGSLVPGAAVEVPSRDRSALSDFEGYFVLELPVPSARENGPSVAERVTVKASREGYVPEERRNVEIISGTTMTVSIQLDQLTSETETMVRIIDEGNRTPRLHSWRFDVTFD